MAFAQGEIQDFGCVVGAGSGEGLGDISLRY